MNAIAGAILILAGSVLVAAGIIAHDVGNKTSDHSTAGYFLGGLLAVVGIAILIAGPLKRGWDSIPVGDERPPVDK